MVKIRVVVISGGGVGEDIRRYALPGGVGDGGGGGGDENNRGAWCGWDSSCSC